MCVTQDKAPQIDVLYKQTYKYCLSVLSQKKHKKKESFNTNCLLGNQKRWGDSRLRYFVNGRGVQWGEKEKLYTIYANSSSVPFFVEHNYCINWGIPVQAEHEVKTSVTYLSISENMTEKTADFSKITSRVHH
jgi:hypothetical protein